MPRGRGRGRGRASAKAAKEQADLSSASTSQSTAKEAQSCNQDQPERPANEDAPSEVQAPVEVDVQDENSECKESGAAETCEKTVTNCGNLDDVETVQDQGKEEHVPTKDAEETDVTTTEADSESVSAATSEEPSVLPKQDAQVSELSEQDGKQVDCRDHLIEKGVAETVATEVQSLVATGVLSNADIGDAAVTCLKSFPEEQIKCALKEFCETDLKEIKDKGDHLVSILRAWQEDKAAQAIQNSGPNEAKIKALLELTGFSHEVTSGQRHYGPPANWEGEPPTHQSEIFIGKVPRDVFEDELVPLCEGIGSLYEIRIMIDPNTGFNRGFAFVRFTDKELAKAAIEKLNDYEIRPGKKIKVTVSTPNLRLFVGNIPKTKTKEEIMEEFSKLTENLKDVIVYSTPEDVNTQRKNRGFCFLHYESHIDAANAKREIGRRGVRVFDSDIFVDWADPIDDTDDSVLADVKILYVRNLSSEVTEEMVREKFGTFGALEKVKRLKDYAFVHFEERDHALKALEALNGCTSLGKCALEVTLARPVSDKAKQRREQRKMEHQAQRWGRNVMRGRGSWGPWGYDPWYGAAAFGAAYSRAMDYGWGGYPAPHMSVNSFRGRGAGYGHRGRGGYGGGYGYGGYGYGGFGGGYGGYPGGYWGGFGDSYSGGGFGRGFNRGGSGYNRGGATKRRAQDQLKSNGASEAKREKTDAAAQERTDKPAPDQDWTSDVAGTW